MKRELSCRAVRAARARAMAAALATLGAWSALAAHAQPAAPPPSPHQRAPHEPAVLHLQAAQMPLSIALGVGPGHERRVRFARPMTIGLPATLAGSLRVQTVGRDSFLTALAPFERTRVIAEDRERGRVVLLDLSAGAATPAEQRPIEVHDDPPAPPDAPAGDAGDAATAAVDYVSLTRHAIRQLYAPRRLAVALPQARRVPVEARADRGLYRGGQVEAVPLAAWHAAPLHVTAVELRNLAATPLELDPRALRGNWSAITFQHGRLLPRGDEADRTVVYLVCGAPYPACR